MKANEKKRAFIDPHEIPPIPGTEGWERMYPYYYRFVPKGVDPAMEEYEDSQFWFVNSLHQSQALLPFECTVDDAWWPSLNQQSTRVICFPTARGLDHRMVYGWVYLCSPEENDPEVIEKKSKVVVKRMNHILENWDKLLERWVPRQYANAKKLDEIKFELPDIVDESYIEKGYSPAHELRMGYLKLLEVIDFNWEFHFQLFNVGLAAYITFSDLCKKLFPGITDRTIGMMAASGVQYDSFAADEKLVELAKLAIDLGVANEILAEGDAGEVEARLARTEAGRKWQQERDKYRDPYFYVGTGFSVMFARDRSWNDDWNLALGLLRDYIRQMQRGEFKPRDIEAKKREADLLADRYRAMIQDPKDREMFDRLLPLARRAAAHAESHMFWGEGQYQPRQYNLLRKLGQLMVDYKILFEPDDIFYFTRWEILELIKDLTNAWSTRAPAAGSWYWKRELQWRKDVYKRMLEWSPPPFLGKVVEQVTDPFTIGLWGITTEMIEKYLAGVTVDVERVSTLHGFEASPGVAEGRARVLKSHTEIDKIQPGEIAIVPCTSPTWGPLFTRVKALVTDIGGMMSHAAIVAREYSLPCVTGTGYATQAIKTGDLVRVDGEKGVVEILERSS